MGDLDKNQKIEGLAFAERLALFAREAPDDDSKRDVYIAVNAIRRRYGFSQAEKMSEVLYCIRQGASTVEDLVYETAFNKFEICRITKELELSRKVRFYTMNCGKKGRPKQMIVAINAG